MSNRAQRIVHVAILVCRAYAQLNLGRTIRSVSLRAIGSLRQHEMFVVVALLFRCYELLEGTGVSSKSGSSTFGIFRVFRQ